MGLHGVHGRDWRADEMNLGVSRGFGALGRRLTLTPSSAHPRAPGGRSGHRPPGDRQGTGPGKPRSRKQKQRKASIVFGNDEALPHHAHSTFGPRHPVRGPPSDSPPIKFPRSQRRNVTLPQLPQIPLFDRHQLISLFLLNRTSTPPTASDTPRRRSPTPDTPPTHTQQP